MKYIDRFLNKIDDIFMHERTEKILLFIMLSAVTGVLSCFIMIIISTLCKTI